MTSTRHDGDTWDLASSVGATATMAAAARAIATRADRSLIDDPFAEPLVRAVGVDLRGAGPPAGHHHRTQRACSTSAANSLTRSTRHARDR